MSDHARPDPTTPARPVRPAPAPAASGPDPDGAVAGPSRRTVLRTAGLVALAGGSATLAACSSDAGVATPAASSAAPPSSSAPASSPSASASAASPSTAASPSATASSKAAPAPSGPGVAASKVPVGGGVVLDDADYVITQPTKGDFKAFSKICTHQGCKVAEVADGSINCKCHGSKFSIKDGSVVNPPARKPLPESKVTVSGGRVVVDG